MFKHRTTTDRKLTNSNIRFDLTLCSEKKIFCFKQVSTYLAFRTFERVYSLIQNMARRLANFNL